MREGTIQRLISYYMDSEKYEAQVEKAKKEFFDADESSVIFAIDPDREPYFLEWFLYDYKLENGKTPLQNFYDDNPKKLPLFELQVYKSMQENEYGPYEALRIDIGEGMEIKSLFSGNKYYVKERAATHSVQKNKIFFARAGRVGNHYELIGSNSFSLDFKIGKGLRGYLKNIKGKVTPKDAMNIYFGENKNEKTYKECDVDNLDDAIKNLDRVLVEAELNGLINANLIKDWLIRFEKEDSDGHYYYKVINILYGLMDDKGDDDLGDLNEVVMAVNDLYNLLPQDSLGGKSPFEKSKEQKEKEIPSEKKLEVNKHSSMTWVKHSVKALEYISDKKFDKAVKENEKIFKILNKNKEIKDDIYRVFANAGLAYFGAGERAIGHRMIEIALELNPNYDFAVDMKKKYEEGGFEDLIYYGVMTQMEKDRRGGKEIGPKWPMDKIEKMSDEKIINEFKKYGIALNKGEFRKLANEFSSAEELAEEKYEAIFEKNDKERENIDFLFFGVQVLWSRWAPDIVQPENFFDYILDLNELVYEDRRSKSKITKLIKTINDDLDKYTVGNIKYIKKFKSELIELCFTLSDIIIEIDGLDDEINSLAEKLVDKFKINLFSLSRIAFKIKHKKEWKKGFEKLNKEYKYDMRIALQIAFIFMDKDDNLVKEYFEKSLKCVELREKDNVQACEFTTTTIFEDYDLILNNLLDFYEGLKDKENVKKIKKYISDVLKKEKELNNSSRSKKIRDTLLDLENKELNEKLEGTDLKNYYDWLISLGINFKTKKLTETPRTYITPEGEVIYPEGQKNIPIKSEKIGRNDPCPCGALNKHGKPLKYKKCCFERSNR